MPLIPDLFALLQPFAALMTEPTFSNLLTILTGWVLSRRHTVSAGLAAGGPLERHFSSYYRVLSKACWSADKVGLRMARLVLALSCVVPMVRVRLIVDDTLCKKKGRLPFGVGMHYDASATGRGLSNSGRSYKVTRGFKADGQPDPDSPAVMFSTDLSLSPRQVVELYAERWSIEVAIHDAKQQLGIAQPQVWCRRSVERAVPTMLLMYSTVVAWFGAGGHRDWKPVIQPWYRGKTNPSFADMLGHLRIKLLDHQLEGVFKDRSNTPVVRKALARFTSLLKQAA